MAKPVSQPDMAEKMVGMEDPKCGHYTWWTHFDCLAASITLITIL